MKPITAEQAEAAATLVHRYGGIRKAARAVGIPFGTLHKQFSRSQRAAVGGRIRALARAEWKLPTKGKVARYIFTCAQSNTRLFAPGWRNLRALAAHYDARLCVSTFTYDKSAYGVASIKSGAKSGPKGEPWYDPAVQPFILDESVIVAPGLIWCGEMNILPTAERPLSGFEAYTGRKSGIFPHTKFAMESIASGKFEGTKFNYTTGTVTQRNYIAKKEGLKADFHHGYGALLVEVDHAGDWFCRQLNANSEGVIHDLTLRAKDGRVTDGHRLEGITWGDLHVGTIPPEIVEATWGAGGMMDVLKPRHQFMEDVLDFRSRNHHDRGDPHKNFQKYWDQRGNVFTELKEVARFLGIRSYRPWCQTVVVDSNHDDALQRWLREGDYRTDPLNALFFLEAQLQVYRAIAAGKLTVLGGRKSGSEGFHLAEWAMRELARRNTGLGAAMRKVRFLRPDESFILCHDATGGIENGMHGHLGVNGSPASLRSFAKMGRKSNTGHGHSAGIIDGAYRSGLMGDNDQGFNEGPGSWSRSHIATYATGKRAILTAWGAKWKA